MAKKGRVLPKNTYIESSDYFPEEIRKEIGLGEYWDGPTMEGGEEQEEEKESGDEKDE